ncbi:hypothetical protein GGS26DRAFT_553802 [Hypomontagnella submonticulosa]|nr:hypothetical protein GGS26DRAFT_553802 [Hypomontagnella submonticulosa]
MFRALAASVVLRLDRSSVLYVTKTSLQKRGVPSHQVPRCDSNKLMKDNLHDLSDNRTNYSCSRQPPRHAYFSRTRDFIVPGGKRSSSGSILTFLLTTHVDSMTALCHEKHHREAYIQTTTNAYDIL